MNFPINTVIFDTVKLRNKGDLSNAEFWNIAGRAGRAYKDKEGYIILSYSNSQKETRSTVKRYIESDLKEVISSLNAYFTGNSTISFDYNVLKEPNNAPNNPPPPDGFASSQPSPTITFANPACSFDRFTFCPFCKLTDIFVPPVALRHYSTSTP